jgi:hypothetical protein
MRHSSALFLIPLALSTTLPAQAQMVTISPEQIGQIFCIGSLGNDMAPVEGILSADLQSLISLAWEENTAFERANPGEKPPLGDGLPWRTWPDYADGCTVVDALAERESAYVTIAYTFSEYPDANYTNELVLLPANFADGAPLVWRIDDVDLGEGHTLRSVLGGLFEP